MPAAFRMAVVCVLAVVPLTASADPIPLFSSTPVDTRICWEDPGIATCLAISDNVVSPVRFQPLRSGELRSVTFWTDQAVTGEYSGGADWFLFADTSTGPSAVPLASGAARDLSRTFVLATSVSLLHQYSFRLATPVLLNAETAYWFSPYVHGQMIAWAAADPSATLLLTTQRHLDGTPLSGAFFETRAAFELSDQAPVPEPGTFALFGLGLLVMRASRARRLR